MIKIENCETVIFEESRIENICLNRDVVVLFKAESEIQALKMMKKVREKMIQAPVIIMTDNPDLFKKERVVHPFFDIIYLPAEDEILVRAVNSAYKEIPLMYLRYYQWANIMRLAGRTEDATRMYESAITLKPSFLPPTIDLCRLCYRSRDYKRAEEVIKRVPGHDSVPELLQIKGKIAFARGELMRAHKFYKKALSLAPFSPVLIMEYGRILLKRRAYREMAGLAVRKVPEFLDMREKMRCAVRRAVKEENIEDVYISARMALKYFPEDREFQDAYRRSAHALGLDGHEEEEEW